MHHGHPFYSVMLLAVALLALVVFALAFRVLYLRRALDRDLAGVPGTIIARFPGTCANCGRRFLPGTRIFWVKGGPTRHFECRTG